LSSVECGFTPYLAHLGSDFLFFFFSLCDQHRICF
jgi:hypothetical protein